jgi:hypothetical protein
VSLLESHEFGDRVIFIITGRSRSRQPFVNVTMAGNEILFSGAGWIATIYPRYVARRLGRDVDLKFRSLETSISASHSGMRPRQRHDAMNG